MVDGKSKILIVEDDLDVAEMLNAYFRVQGYEVFTVNWGEDGVRAATECREWMEAFYRAIDRVGLDAMAEVIRQADGCKSSQLLRKALNL